MPEDFAFQLSREDFDASMSQSAISNTGRGGRRKLSWTFTEHGILMLSSVLRSEQAVQVNIAIMRAFGDVRAQGDVKMLGGPLLRGHIRTLARAGVVDKN